ncbi:MAG: class I SAM-dependent methyltransferase [Thermodesulfovibrionales bacterium]
MKNDNAYKNDSCLICGGEGALYHEIAGYVIDRCRACGFAYVRDIPSDFELFQVYDQGYKTREGLFAPKLRKSRKFKYWLLGRMIRFAAGRGRIRLLEIGCGQGSLLQAVSNDRHFDAEGIDYAQGPVDYARSLGLKASQSSLEQMQYAPESFDFIVAIHVIEHMQNLDAVFQEITRILKKGGQLYIVVPCISHIKARLNGKRWKYLGPPEHLWYFSTQALKTFLEQRGFRIQFAHCISHRAHLRVLAQKI